MRFLSLFSGCGGMDLGLEKAGMKCVGQVEIMHYALRILKQHWPTIPKHTDISTFCVGAGLVRTIQSRATEPDTPERKLATTDPDREGSVTGLSPELDTARGIVIGNAVTVPVAEWIGKRIMVYEQSQKVLSL